MENRLLDALFRNRSEFGSIVPEEFLSKPHMEINFPEELIKYLKNHRGENLNTKDLINPDKCAKLVRKIQRKLGVAWSYGGWLEDRSVILRDSYLKKTKSWVHLGIDVNLPVGTPIRAATEGTVHMTGSDYPEEGGWGNFVILKHRIDDIFIFSICGHLGGKIRVCKRQYVLRGDIIGYVGNTRENGFWFPHVHFQFISQEKMESHQNPFTLDGYGRPEDLSELRRHYPNPLVCLPMGNQKTT